MAFFDNLMALCEKRGVKITPFIKSLGLSESAINRWKNGTLPNGEVLCKLSDAFDCSIDDLLGRETEKKNAPMPESSDTEANVRNILLDGFIRAGLMSPGKDISDDKLRIINDCLDIIARTLKD